MLACSRASIPSCSASCPPDLSATTGAGGALIFARETHGSSPLDADLYASVIASSALCRRQISACSPQSNACSSASEPGSTHRAIICRLSAAARPISSAGKPDSSTAGKLGVQSLGIPQRVAIFVPAALPASGATSGHLLATFASAKLVCMAAS